MRYPPSVASTFIKTVAVNGHATLNDAPFGASSDHPRRLRRAGRLRRVVVLVPVDLLCRAVFGEGADHYCAAGLTDNAADDSGAAYVFVY